MPNFWSMSSSQGARHLVHEFQAILGRKYRFNKLTTPNDLWILYQINICKPMLYKCRKHVSLYVYCIYFLCVYFIISLYISYAYYIGGSFTSVSFARIHPYTTGSNQIQKTVATFAMFHNIRLNYSSATTGILINKCIST